jgi:hypothetical protein
MPPADDSKPADQSTAAAPAAAAPTPPVTPAGDPPAAKPAKPVAKASPDGEPEAAPRGHRMPLSSAVGLADVFKRLGRKPPVQIRAQLEANGYDFGAEPPPITSSSIDEASKEA